MAGIDNFTKLMLHCNGLDTSTTFTDDSFSAHTVTAQADAQIDTAQSKFGGASGLFDGSSDRLDIPDSEDWNFGSGDFTIDFWAKFAGLGSTSHMCSQWEFGNDKSFAIRKTNTNLFDMEYRTSGGTNSSSASTFTLSDTNWHHYAIVRDGNTLRFFVDGVAEGTDNWTGITLNNATRVLHVSSLNDGTQAMNGWIDELRISKGIARWTSNFTPPTEEYSIDIIDESDDLEIADTILVIDTAILESEDLEITDSIEVIDTTIIESDNIQIADSVTVTDTTLPLTDAIQITDSIILTGTNTDAKFATKIISINPLIFVTDTSPIEIIKVDTTDPENLTWVVQSISGINNAKDITINGAEDYIYIGGDNGKVVKVEVADLSNQTIIDLNDTDDIITIEHNENFGIIYAGTDNNVGELYTIDERSTFKLDTDFTCLSPKQFKIPSSFNIIDVFKMDSAFTALSEITFKMKSDFKCLTKELSPITSIDDIVPINLEDYQVFVDSVELEDTDLVLNSISITHSEGEESRASFRLSRQHDNLDVTLEGISSEITNQNIVEIKCRGITIFPYKGVGTGRISEINCQYQDNTEFVIVSALSEEATNQFNTVTMSLPGVTDRLSIYDILIQNPVIFNPYVDPDNEDNPKKYKGIRVNLGQIIQQSLTKQTVTDGRGTIADQIQNGEFISIQNWTYFWGHLHATKFSPVTSNDLGTQKDPEELEEEQRLGEIAGKTFFYIGTSLSPVSEDLWDLSRAGYHRQRIYDDIETDLGFYEVGEAPFKDISVRNGRLITKPKLVDDTNGLFSFKEAGNDFVQYAKRVANLEYEKLKNINDDILPDTSCTFNLTIDAYLYYGISLLTKINIDNTTQANIYNNNKGFPVSAKSITITSSDRRVSIEANNIKSTKELEVINSEFPDEDDDEYNEEERRILISAKSNMKTGLKVD